MIPAAQISRRIGLVGAGFATLAATVAPGLWWQLFRRPLPRTEGRIRLSALEGAVEVSRDRWGVPHIRARTRHDLWFGQGFCTGQDRLWQLELYRRAAWGRIAEIAGPDGLPSDRFMRTLGIRHVAEREAAAMEGELRLGAEAYCAGVNAAAAEARALPPELQILRLGFEPWTAADMLTTGKLLSLGLSTNWERELLRADMVRELGAELTQRLDPIYPPANPIVLRPGEEWSGDGLALSEQISRLRQSLGLGIEATGSNNWAVSGSRSATGSALMAGDPHLPPSMPGITYQCGLYLGDRFCRGASLPGQPGVVFGQGNDVAWSFTNAMADVMDLFVERLDGDMYEFEGERRPLETVVEEIAVRKRTEPERLVVRRTHHGPLVNEALGADESEPLALRWMSLDFPAVSVANVSTLDVTSGPELVELLARHHTPVSNLVWADGGGSIGYKTVGRLPIRAGGCPDLPKPGWSGEHEWQGWVPYEEMPELVDPESGYVVTANNRIADTDFAHHITSDYLDGYRAARIAELIESRPEHDLDDFARMQTDMLSIPGLETARRLARLSDHGAEPPLDQRETAAIERLRSWDGRMTPESVAATIYQAFTLRLAREVTRAAIGDQELIGGPWDELALDALRAALDELADRYGADPAGWRWGVVHALEFPHALGGANPLLRRIFNRRLEVGGGQETVAQVGWDPGTPFRAIWAPCWRMVADPATPERSRWQQFTGNSGQPASPHYDDLQEGWRDGHTQSMAGEGPWRVLTLEPKPNGQRKVTSR